MTDEPRGGEPTRPPRGRNRASIVLIVAVVVALVAGGTWLLRSERGAKTSGGRAEEPTAGTTGSAVTPTPTPLPTPTPTPTQTPTPTLAVGSRGYRYIWTGTPGRRFTTSEFEALARLDSLVVIEKGYGNTFADHDAAARRLMSLNPHLIVLVDFLAGALPPALAARWGPAFQDRWLLRDQNGDPIGDCSEGRCKYRVDVADPSYRRFVIGQVLRRLHAAPYGGVMYDNLHYYDRRQYPDLTDQQITRLNAGFRSLLRETRRAIGPDTALFYNGVSRNVGHIDVVNRGFDLLATADGAQDETYCYLDNENRFRAGDALAADDRRYFRLASRGSTVLESVHLESAAAQADAAHIGRYCFANYLMSSVAGHTFVQFKRYADQSQGPQITTNGTPEQRLELGEPVGRFERKGTILRRRFERGWVFVNVGTSPARISLPARLTLWNGGIEGDRFARGDSYTIPPEDAGYFLGAR